MTMKSGTLGNLLLYSIDFAGNKTPGISLLR